MIPSDRRQIHYSPLSSIINVLSRSVRSHHVELLRHGRRESAGLLVARHGGDCGNSAPQLGKRGRCAPKWGVEKV